MNENCPPPREVPDSLMLHGFWYRALPAEQVGGRHLRKAVLLETPLAVGRDGQGLPFALHDACPHRGMPLSHGRFDGQQVECSYHGWRFDGHTGQCQLIPSLTADQKLKIGRQCPRLAFPRSARNTSWPTSPPTCRAPLTTESSG
jgi:phenylpropionate dioxygenase-like ring-hydroxylating dioxygenase large terminal subunit